MIEIAKVRELIKTTNAVAPYLNENEVNSIFIILLAALERMEKESNDDI